MNIFIASFFTFMISCICTFGMDFGVLDDYAQRSLTHAQRGNGYRNIQTHGNRVEDDLEKFLFSHIFDKTKRISHTHEKLLEIARNADPLVLKYAVHAGFFHHMNTKSKISQLRHVTKVSLPVLYAAHTANLLSSDDLRDRQYSLYYLQSIDDSSLTQLLSMLDFSLFDAPRRHLILKHLQGVNPESLAIMQRNNLLSFRKVGPNGGYSGQEHLSENLKILEALKGKTPNFVAKAIEPLRQEPLMKPPKNVMTRLRIGEWITLIDALSPEKQAFIQDQSLFEGCTNRQKNRTIKSIEMIDLDVLNLASQNGLLRFSPRERVRVLKALQGKSVADLEGVKEGNSKLIIKAL